MGKPRKRKANASFDVPASPSAGKPTGWVYRSEPAASPAGSRPRAEGTGGPVPSPAGSRPRAEGTEEPTAGTAARGVKRPATPAPAPKPAPVETQKPAPAALAMAKPEPPKNPVSRADAPLIAIPPVVAAARAAQATPPPAPATPEPAPASPPPPPPSAPPRGLLMGALDFAVTPLVVGLLFVLTPFGGGATRRPPRN